MFSSDQSVWENALAINIQCYDIQATNLKNYLLMHNQENASDETVRQP